MFYKVDKNPNKEHIAVANMSASNPPATGARQPVQGLTAGGRRKGWHPWRLLLLLCCLLTLSESEAKVLSVGVYQNPPKIFFDSAGTASGLLIDLLRQIASREDWQLRFVPCEWQTCLQWAEEGKIDILPDVAWTEQREKVLQYSAVPALYSWSILYRNRAVVIDSVFDLKGKKIGLLDSSVQSGYFRSLMDNSGIKLTLVPLKSVEEGFRMTAAGQIDGIIASQQAGDMLADRYRLADTSIVFQPVKLFFVSSKQQPPETLAAIDRALSQWQADPQSIYFDILRKWGRGATSLPTYMWWLRAAPWHCWCAPC